MKNKRKLPNQFLVGLISVLLVSSLGFILLKSNSVLGRKLIYLSYDLPFLSRPIIKPQEVVLVYMDDDSHKELHQSFTAAWDRELHARLLERLTADNAKAVVFDIVFSDPGPDAAADEHFARALRQHGKVVLAADYVPSGTSLMPGMTLTPPFDLFRVAVNNHWGIAQLNEDSDFMIRQHYFGPGDPPYLTLARAAGALVDAQNSKDLGPRYERWLNYYGPPLTLNQCSYSQALYPEGVPSGYFSNKVVYVGAHLATVFSGVRKDEFKNPYTATFRARDPNQLIFMPGVEVQATTFLNLWRGDWLTRTSRSLETLLVLLAGPLFGLGLLFSRPFKATALALLSVLIITLLALTLFSKAHIWFPWMIIVAAQIPVALLWSLLINSVHLYVQNRLYEQSLQMYLSPKLVKKFSHDKDLLKPGARKQVLTVLFSDIVDFTALSEGMDSDDLARAMNYYFETAVSQSIHATDGTVVKYLGDSIFAFWNAPDAQSDHALRACEAALRFRDLPPQYINGRPLVTRLGLHTGVANVGNFGSADRVDYTAIGESINLASRMEGLNKYLGTKILITAGTYEGLAGRLLTRFLGPFKLKGFEKSVPVYELVGSVDRAEACRPLHAAFAQALNLFQQKDFTMAQLAFRQVLEIDPADGPAQFYLKSISELGDHPLPADWKGETVFTEK